MKIALTLVCILVPLYAEAAIELSGLMVSPENAQFVLHDTSSGVTSGWLKVGETFEGCEIIGFHGDTDVLDVKIDKEIAHLVLKDSKVADAPPQPISDRERVRRKRLVEMYYGLDELIYADVTSDSEHTYITPREVWKGSYFAVGVTVAVPNAGGSQFRKGAFGLWVMAAKLSADGSLGSTMMMAGTDGKIVAASIPIEDFRDYDAGGNSTADSQNPVAAAGQSK